MKRALNSGLPGLLLLFWIGLAPDLCFGAASDCPPGKQVLWYFPESALDEKTSKGFSRELATALSEPLSTLGYWLTPLSPKDSLIHAPLYSECLVMKLYVRDAIEGQDEENGDGEKEIFIALAKLKEWNSSRGDVFRTLFSLRFFPSDLGAIKTIFITKLIENLRTQYICSITIATDPKGASVTAGNGLSDRTPLDWVLPVGTLTVRCSMNKYLPLETGLNFPNPGQYNYFFQLRKRQFYHSRFIYPAVVAAVASGVALGFKYYYYDRYHGYGNEERVQTPEVFEQTFRKVQTCERVSLASLVVSGAFFGVTFWF